MRAGEPSETARRVATYRLRFPRAPASLGDPAADDRLQADIAAARQPRTTGLTDYLSRRTAFFDHTVVDAIEDGIAQIVVVGAGYDARALRYAKPGVDWFELDHPDTQADKRSRLERLGIGAAGVTFVGMDFAQVDVGAALRHAGHDRGRVSLFVCEGVAGYLSYEVLRSLLAALSRCAAAGSRLAISIPLQPTSSRGQAGRAALATAVAQVGEPLVTALRRAQLATLLETTGWTEVRVADPSGATLDGDAGGAAFVIAEPAG